MFVDEQKAREIAAATSAIMQAPDLPPSKPNGRAPDKLKSFDGLAIYNSKFDELPCVISDLLFCGVTLFAGRPKVGKSWLTLHLAIAVATGESLWGKLAIERPGRVVYCALEEPQSRTSARLKKVTRAIPALQNLHFIYRLKPLLGAGAADLDEYLNANPASLVIIDTLSSIVQANGKRDVFRSDYNEVNLLRQLAEKHKTAIVVVTHLRKMGADSVVDAVAGTTGLTAACDAIWGLKRPYSGESLLEVTGREMEEKTYALRFETTDEQFGWNLVGEGAEHRLSEERRDIITLLRDEAPLQPARIALMLRKNANTTRVLLQKMAQKGDIVKTKNGYVTSSLSFISINNVNERERVNE